MSGETEAVWKTLATGGRWTASELRVHHPRVKVWTILHNMVRANMVKCYDTEPRTYGITGDCLPARTMTVGEILKAVTS